MTLLLHIASSSQTSWSHSSDFSDRSEAGWVAVNCGTDVNRRDLAADPLPHIADSAIVGLEATIADEPAVSAKIRRASDTIEKLAKAA